MATKLIGENRRPLICTPVVGVTTETIVEELEQVLAKKPDIIEWRVDFFAKAAEQDAVCAMVDTLKARMDDLPLIFTFRSQREGGQRQGPALALRGDRRTAPAGVGPADRVGLGPLRRLPRRRPHHRQAHLQPGPGVPSARVAAAARQVRHRLQGTHPGRPVPGRERLLRLQRGLLQLRPARLRRRRSG